MMLTKEMLIHIALVTAVTGSVFAVILDSGATRLDELDMQVLFAKTKLADDGIVFLSYAIYNTGDYDIQRVTVTLHCCSFVKSLENQDQTPIIPVMGSQEYFDVIPDTGMRAGQELVIQFEAYDTHGNYDVDTVVAMLD